MSQFYHTSFQFFYTDSVSHILCFFQGTLEDGTEFDNSYKRGEPLSFTLGSGQVIRGWDQGLLKLEQFFIQIKLPSLQFS